MSENDSIDGAVLPPLLRPQAFDHPGAADWVATQPALRQPSAHWLVIACVLGLATCVLVLANVSYRQAYRYAGYVPGDSLSCRPSGCAVSLASLVPTPRTGEMTIGSRITLASSGRAPVVARVLARPANGGERAERWRVSWPAGTPLPAGPVQVEGSQERSLLAWMLPPRASGADSAGAP